MSNSKTEATSEVFCDKTKALSGCAWFWRLSDDEADDDPVGPYLTKRDAEAAARECLALRRSR